MDSLINIILLFLIIVNAVSLGKLFLRKFKDISYLEYNLVCCSLGLFVFSYITFILGNIRLLYKEMFYILLIFFTMIFIKENITTLKDIRDIFNYKTKNYIFLFFCSAIFLTLLLSLSPSIYWDELYYHLTIPKIYILQHSIIDIPHLFYSNFPQGIEMLFLFSMLISDDILSNLIHWIFGVLCAISVFVMARKFYNVNVAILSATIFFLTPTVMRLSSLAYIDLGTSLYVILSFYLIILWNITKETKYFYLSSVFSGIAFSSKHSAVIGLILINIFILSNFIMSRRNNITLRQYFLFNLFSFLIPFPYYLKSLYYTGNPVYPFLYTIFGGRNLTPVISQKLTTAILEFGMMRKELKEFLLLPWNLTIYHGKFWGVVSPIYLSFLPLIIFFKRDKITKILLFFGVGYLYILFFLSQQIRFLIPSLAVLSIICSIVVFKIKEKFVYLYYFSLLSVILSFIFSIGFIFYTSYIRLPVALGMQTKEDFLEKNLDIYPLCRYINENLPLNSKIFFINDNRIYYCNRNFLIPSPLTDFLINVSTLERYKYLKTKKVTHIALNINLIKLSQKDTIVSLIIQDLKQKYLKKVFDKNGIFLFEILPI